MIGLTPHQQTALDTKGNLALTANAGSGKTFVLARKYLSVLMNEGIDVSNVAAITFTEKAASELYYKISVLIDESIKSTNQNEERKRLEKIRRQLVSANISTIHSFCIDILRQFPVEAELDARFVPIDENLSNDLIEISVEEIIKTGFDDELVRDELKNLIRIFNSRSRLQTEIVKLIKNRKNVFAIQEKIYNQDIDGITASFENNFYIYFELIWERLKKDFLEELIKVNSIILNNEAENDIAIKIKAEIDKLKSEEKVEEIIISLKEIKTLGFTKTGEIRSQGYFKAKFRESVVYDFDTLKSNMNALSKFEFSEEHKIDEENLAKFGISILRFFNQALKNYSDKKRTEGFLDFEDILLHTKILLQNELVKKSLSDKFKFIMVDEFQDTNEIQYQIFLPILDYLNNGELFIVGDEKQSIYKFRDAEIEIFNQTRENIKTASGENNLLNLPDSFRMSPAICTFTNYLFRKTFLDPFRLFGEVSNTDLVCARNDDVKGKVAFLISRISDYSKNVSESALVANKILEIIGEGNYNWKDICILVRKRKNFDDLEKEFLKQSIPYTIIGGRGFYQRQTISDIYNYLSFLIDENNSSALVGILRSPFFSVSDAKLFEISLQEGSSFWKKFTSFVRERNEFIKVYKILRENINLSNSIELPTLLKKILSDINYLGIISSRIDGAQESANLDKLISIARNFNSKGFRNLFDFINYLKDSISGLEDEAQATFANNLDSVQLMTIHQSKGLEFPIVFIYKSSEGGLSNILKSGQIQIDKSFGLLAKLPRNNNFLEDYHSAPIVSVYNFLEMRKNLAELKRLLYVAITRAKDELYISTEIKENKKNSEDSFISLIDSVLDYKLDDNEIFIKDKLEYLVKKNNTYFSKSEMFELNIPLISNSIEINDIKNRKEKIISDIILELGGIKATERGEIISASKVSIYSQCPLKYFLTYEYGFSKLNYELLKHRNKQKNSKSYNFFEDVNEIDDEEFDVVENNSDNFSSADFGSIIHQILEKEIENNELTNYLNKLKKEETASALSDDIINKIKDDLGKFYKSSVYNHLKNIKNFKNEFEIYVKETGYYLHGILDKIAINDKKIEIYDYKTDEVEESEVKKRADYYLMQLKFYLYIASKLFKGFDIFEGTLIFIKQPEIPFKICFNKNEVKGLHMEIEKVIDSLRQKKGDKNYNHCLTCVFSGFTKNCIVK